MLWHCLAVNSWVQFASGRGASRFLCAPTEFLGKPTIPCDFLPEKPSVFEENGGLLNKASASPASNSKARSAGTARFSDWTDIHPSLIATSRDCLAAAFGLRPNSARTPGGMMSVPSCARRTSRRSISARLESGDVLLTAGISEVSFQVLQAVLPRDAAFAQLGAKSKPIQLRHPSRLAHREPALGVVSTRQFDLHVAFAFARTQKADWRGPVRRGRG